MNNWWTKHKNGYEIRRKVNKNLKFRIGNVVAWGDAAACLFMTPLKITWLKNVKVVFAKENSNLALIPRRLTNHSVPWVIEELDAVDSGQWTVSMILQRLIAKRVHQKNWSFCGRYIEWHFWRDDQVSFLECFQIMMCLRYFFITTSSVFLFFFFFFLKVQSQNRGAYYTQARIIHG